MSVLEERNCLDGSSRRESREPGKLKRGLFVVAGTVCLGLGALGVFLPVLPTTPFLLLAAACYYKGSKRLHRWMLSNRWFGKYVRNYMEGKGVSLRAKFFAVVFLWVAIVFSVVFFVPVLVVQVILLIVAVAVTVHIVMLPTSKNP